MLKPSVLKFKMATSPEINRTCWERATPDGIYEGVVGGKPLQGWERGGELDGSLQHPATGSADDGDNLT